jgi:hypothetical protein
MIPDANESSKAALQKPVDALAISFVAPISANPPSTGADLMACTYNGARSSAQWVLGYLESLKDVEAEWKGNKSSLTALDYLHFC